MGSRDSDRARRLFLEALDQDPAQRDAFLDRECSGDPALRDEVETLLERDGRTDDVLGSAPPPPPMAPSNR
jgi:hypothetical protein